MRTARPSHKPAPELRLPVLVFSALPISDPVGAIHEVLIERHSELRCELETPQWIAADVVPYRCEQGQRFDLRQKPHDPPRQHCRIELRRLRYLPEHGAVKLPRIGIGEWKRHVRADAAMIRKPEREPARNAAALHHHDFARERRSERL